MSHYDCKECHQDPVSGHAPDCSRVKGEPLYGWLIYKGGRGWYRQNASGYTMNPAEAGRYSYIDAIRYSHPNGLDGPRDGMTIKHESAVPGATPSARITGDKGRGNLAEGAHYGDGIIGRCLALEERGDLLAVALAEAISDMTAEIESRRNAELPRRIERDLAIVADWKRALDNWRAGR